MIIHDFSNQESILQHFVAELRNIDRQKDRRRFENSIERIGFILGYELSKLLAYESQQIRTPFDTKEMRLPLNLPVVCAILRAGLPLQQGVRHCFDQSDAAFISAYRKRTEDETIETIVEYLASPDLQNRDLILCDPMIATGTTLVTVNSVLQAPQRAKTIHVVAVIGSEEGVARVEQSFPEESHLWITGIDKDLSAKKYILPGLGDAGDLTYGKKE